MRILVVMNRILNSQRTRRWFVLTEQRLWLYSITQGIYYIYHLLFTHVLYNIVYLNVTMSLYIMLKATIF